jgi:hypothetical protein
VSTFLPDPQVDISEIAANRLNSLPNFVLRGMRAFERFASSPLLIIVVFSLVYFGPTVWIAAHKLLWDDEFFTLYISATPGWHEIINAISTGADQHPPSFYYLTHIFFDAFRMSHITVRLPEILAYWLMCVLLYLLIRHLLGNTWGILGMLLPLSFEGMYYYASEARGYALLLAFSALALLSWIRVAEGFRRRLFLPLLAFGLAAAVASHYYGVLMALALGLAEVFRTYQRRKVDLPVWIAFAATLVPLIAFFPVIRSSQQYVGHFWARPQWRRVFVFFPTMLGSFLNVLIGASAFAVWLKSRQPREADTANSHRLPTWIVIAVVNVSLIPCFAIVMAKTVTHGYTDRYAIPGTIGACILCTYLLYRLSDARGLLAPVCIVLSLVTYSLNAYSYAYSAWGASSDLRDIRYYLDHQASTGPVVVAEITVFHRLSFYAPAQLRRRLVYVADPDSSVKYLHQDTVDRGLLALRPWFPLNVVPARQYVEAHPSFWVYGYVVGEWSWLTYDLANPALDTKLIGRKDWRLLFSVQNASTLKRDFDANEDDLQIPSLYSKYKDEPESLCAMYMGPKSCPSL